MTTQRTERVAAAFRRRTATIPSTRLCELCVEALDVSGAGLTLMTDRHSQPVSSSDRRAGDLDELQFSLGEGPSPDAYGSRAPVGEPDLEHATLLRWPSFTPLALAIGTRGAFAFPLAVGDQVIGVLTLYRDSAGTLSDEQTTDSLVVAGLLAETMVARQAQSPLDVLDDELSHDGTHRAEVHQAAGMVAVQLGIDVSEALVRIRAHAFATDRPAALVAGDIVARELRLPAASDS